MGPEDEKISHKYHNCIAKETPNSLYVNNSSPALKIHQEMQFLRKETKEARKTESMA